MYLHMLFVKGLSVFFSVNMNKVDILFNLIGGISSIFALISNE